ncbi:MAG: type II secretion system F family protein [Actinomycetota bacterium]
MTAALIAVLGASGLVLALSGLPPFRRSRIAERVNPYLSGLHGRPSSLLVRHISGRNALERRVETALQRLGFSTDRGLTPRLRAAGLELDPGGFRLEQLIWGTTATVASWALTVSATVVGVGFDLRALPALSAVGLTGGFLARDWWLSRQVEARHSALQEELPTAIDLITLSIMAGESVPAAFARVAALLRTGIGDEFGRVVADVRAGSSTVDALDALRGRLPLPGVSRLVDALATGIERGAPLAEVLRAQADDGREARRRMLLEMGGRREVLMLVPVVFLIMPVVVVFALLPGLVSLELLVP